MLGVAVLPMDILADAAPIVAWACASWLIAFYSEGFIITSTLQVVLHGPSCCQAFGLLDSRFLRLAEKQLPSIDNNPVIRPPVFACFGEWHQPHYHANAVLASDHGLWRDTGVVYRRGGLL
jgi:hypothetical protein